MELKYFDLSEFKCKCGKCNGYPPNGMSRILLLALDELREKIGRPVYVSSGYRCEEWNRANNGVSNSTHTLGCACDIYVEGMSVYELAKICKEIFDGVGEYYQQGFVHVDMRSNGAETGYYQWDDENY